jgi:hypothetical protein
MAMNATDITAVTRSSTELRLIAEKQPSGMPSSVAPPIATNTSASV